MLSIKTIRSKLFTSESGGVFKGMLTLMAGAGLARVLGIACIPILTRIYSPEDYGLLAFYTSFTMLLAPMLTLRYVQAIPLPKTDIMAFCLFSLCFKLIIIGSLFSAVVLLMFGENILKWFSMEALMPWWWLIVLGAAGTAFYELFSLWATRKRQYKVIAKTQFFQALIGNLAKIGLGLLAIKSIGLIVGQFLNQSSGVAGFIRESKPEFKKLIPKVSRRKEIFVAKYYQEFLWFRLPSQFLMVLSIQAPVFMTAALYNKEVTGQLSLAVMALSLPVSLIGQAMAKAYYAEIARVGKKNVAKIRRITVDVQKKLFLIGLPITLLAILLSKHMFVIVFGKDWALAGEYAAILAPFILFQFTSSPLMEVINVVGSQILFLLIHALRILGLIGLFFLTKVLAWDDHLFIILLSFYLSVFYLSASSLVFIMLSKKTRGA